MRYVSDLTKVKPEEIQYINGADVLAIVPTPNSRREDYEVVVIFVDGSCGAYTIDGKAYQTSGQCFQYRPRKVAYIKPLHVVLSENPYLILDGHLSIGSRMDGNYLISPVYVHFKDISNIFGRREKEFKTDTYSSWLKCQGGCLVSVPESWIEYKEEE